MAVISLTIVASSFEIMDGIPSTVSVTANIPSSIFYTLDGTDPTTGSSVVVGPIIMPTDAGKVILKLYATNGTDTSGIIEEIYLSTIVGDRLPHTTISGLHQNPIGSAFPFGSYPTTGGSPRYGEVGPVIVDAANIVGIPDGYDGQGGVGTYTDLPLSEYDFVFSTTNSIGQTGRGIGTLPATTTIYIPPNEQPTNQWGSPNTSSPFFNPRSFVILDSFRDTPYDAEVARTFRATFTTENVQTARYGNGLFSTSEDCPPMRGSMLKPQFNPRTNTMTYYYYDNDTNRWIKSETAYSPRTDVANLAKIVIGRETGAGYVYKWIPFKYRVLP